MTGSPLLITLQLDDASAHFFNRLRQQHFPAERNFLKAHLTLFHHLPPAEEPAIRENLLKWSKEHEALPLLVSEVKSIGGGVAYKIDCPPLLQLHRSMQAAWRPWLKPQDKQQLWPHITVQNKVTSQVAQQTLELLKENFTPFTATGIAVELWSYEGGPWNFIEQFPFTNPSSSHIG